MEDNMRGILLIMLTLKYALTLLVGGLDHGGGLPKEVVGSLAGWCSLVGQCLENSIIIIVIIITIMIIMIIMVIVTIIITWSKSMESNIREQWRSSARPPVKYQIC